MSDSAHDSVEGFFYWKQRADAAEAKLAIMREQLTERDVELDRAVLKLADVLGEVRRVDGALAAERAKLEKLQDAYGELLESEVAERAKTAKLVDAAEGAVLSGGAGPYLDVLRKALAAAKASE